MGAFQQLWEVYKEGGDEDTVHRSVARRLGTDADAPAVGDFMRELESFLADEDVLLLMLSIGLGGVFESPSSFLGLLLREEVLQPRLVDVLLEKLAEFAAVLDAQMMDKNVPKLILRELRWMDLVVDSQQVVEKLIAALPAFPPTLQQEVIYILPELASDEDAVIVVNALMELIRNESAMVVCCIEALGNFNVLTDQTSAVLHCILERLDSSPMSDLPVIVKYLIQEAPMLDVEQVVEQVREKVSTMVALTSTADGTVPRSGQEEEVLILGSIVQGMHFRGDLMKAFLSQMQSASQWLLLDVWLLIGAHSIPQPRVKLEKLLVKKVKAGVVTPDLLVQSVMGHGNALKPYFLSILSLASVLIGQTTSAECRNFGSTLYQVLFEEFSGQRGTNSSNTQAAFYQGEIVSAILGHCLANGTDATTVGMDTLMALVAPSTRRSPSGRSPTSRTSPRGLRLSSSLSQRRQRLRVFLPSLKQMLDTMELYSADQVRKMYDVLFAIAGHDDSDLCNVLRKQGFHQHIRYRSFGIIGTISRLRRVLEHFRESDSERENSNDAAGTTQSLQPVGSGAPDAAATKSFNAVLVELHNSCKSNAQCISFMLDELTILVSTLTLDKYADVLLSIVFDYYMDILSTHFMDDFDWRRKTEGVYSKPVLGGVMKSELWLGLDEKRSPVYLKILDLVVSPNVVERESLLYLTSLVSLVMSCARKRSQVSEIECVLICPVQLMEKSVLSELSGIDDRAAQNAICCCLWYAINWTRSLLNFFASESKEYYVAKVMQRLEDLSRLEATLLEETLDACPMFSAPGSAHATDLPTAGKGKLEVKKRGRPPKSANDSSGRASAIKNSFLPLQSEVLNILAFPRLLHDDAAGAANSSDSARSPVETLPIKEEKLSRVGLLFSLLLSYLESCCKKKAPSHWTATNKQPTESSNWTASHSLTKSGDMLLSDLIKAGVLNAAGVFAREFVARIIRYQKGSPGDEEETKQAEEDDNADEAIKLMLKRILGDYLKIVAVVMNNGFVKSSDDDDGPDAKALIDHAEQLILAPNDRNASVTGGDDDLKMVITKCFANVQEYQRVVEDDLSMAVALLKCLTSLLSLVYGFDSVQFINRTAVIDLRGGDSERTPQATHTDPAIARMDEAINAMALSYLETDWSGGDAKYAHPTAQLEALLRCYIFYGPIVLDNIQALAIDGFVELLEQNGKRTSKLPTLDKKSVAIYHRVMFDALVAATSRLDLAANDTQFVFNYLGQAVLLFKLLVCLTKSFHKSMIIATVLKTGRKFIETILQVMPFFEAQFQKHMDRVIKIITDVQVATRRIQVLCAHGKLIKDQSTASQVPKMKRLLEKLIYRGEALASANGVLQFYSTGVLKNRRIDGTAITKEELEGSTESGGESEHEEETAGDQEEDTETEGEEQVKGEVGAEGEADEDEADEGENAPATGERPRKRR